MIRVKIRKLFKDVNCRIDSGVASIDITSIATNSKSVKRRGLFVAIKGFGYDGHDFLDQAFKKGARIALVEKTLKSKNTIKVKDTRKALSLIARNYYNAPSKKLKVLGVTGTNGKTTVSFLIKSILDKAALPCGLIGTIEYKIGKHIIPAGRTTPDALYLNFLMRKALKVKEKAVVMEISSHALDQKRADNIPLEAAIFTNLTHEHLDYHGNMKKYLKSKAKIFENLKKSGRAILNVDDKNIRPLEKSIKKKVITYGMKKSAYISAKIKKLELDGSSFTVRIKNKDSFSINTKLVGLHNVSNILAAVATGIALGVDKKMIKKGIESVANINGRLESIDMGQKFKIFVDYAHTHNALENVLSFLNQSKKRNIITVFGCGGERDKKKRSLMGHVAEQLSDFVILTNDNPRGEDPLKIIKDIKKGMNSKKYIAVPNRKKAIEKALKKAKKDDIVLIAGKGHEKFQIEGMKKIPFDDRKIVRGILSK